MTREELLGLVRSAASPHNRPAAAAAAADAFKERKDSDIKVRAPTDHTTGRLTANQRRE